MHYTLDGFFYISSCNGIEIDNIGILWVIILIKNVGNLFIDKIRELHFIIFYNGICGLLDEDIEVNLNYFL